MSTGACCPSDSRVEIAAGTGGSFMHCSPEFGEVVGAAVRRYGLHPTILPVGPAPSSEQGLSIC